MAHRKFSVSRHGNLGYLPRKRCASSRARIGAFPVDCIKEKPHLTAFLGYKAGCTHVQRLVEHRGSALNGANIIQATTIIDCPPLIACGVVGYVETLKGKQALTTVWATHVSDEVIRRLYKTQASKTQRKAFTKYQAAMNAHPEEMDKAFERMAKVCTTIRVIAHSQPSKTPLAVKKAHIIEIQVNGGDIKQKIDFAKSLLEKEIAVSSIFSEGDQIDTVSITRGRGFEGVTHRWGTTRLPRKTRRGNRKVACIGSWHPANVQYTVARAGQCGYYHRTETNKQIFRIGNATDAKSGSTSYDLTDKTINPLGGFVNYGFIRGDFVMIKGSCPGTPKRVVVMRKAILPHRNVDSPNIQWICTASKQGHGHFETSAEKKRFFAKVAK